MWGWKLSISPAVAMNPMAPATLVAVQVNLKIQPEGSPSTPGQLAQKFSVVAEEDSQPLGEGENDLPVREGTGVPSSNNFQVLSIGCTFGTIGRRRVAWSLVWFFPGHIDDAAVWDHALTGAEVAAVFDSGVDASSAGLVGYWSFDEGGGQLVSDGSSAGNDGFLGESPQSDSADPAWELGQ